MTADLCVHEDVAPLTACADSGLSIAWASDLPVATSARRMTRAPGGFASYLNDLERAEPTAVAPRSMRCNCAARLEPTR